MDPVKIHSIHYYPYRMALERPFVLKGASSLDKREGAIVHMICDKGLMGLGDMAPLPGISEEPLKKAIFQLDHLAEEWKGAAIPVDREGVLAFLRARLCDDIIAPSVRFALESAILSLVAGHLNTTVAQFLGGDVPKSVFCAGLLQGGLQEARLQMMRLKAKGYKTFDLMVSGRNIPLSIQKVESLKELMAPREQLRLFADGEWTAQEAVLFLQAAGKNQISFLADPCQDTLLWNDIYRRTDMPLAMTGAGANLMPEALETFLGVQTLVVIPMISGGILGFWDTCRKARDSGRRVVVKSAFESGVGQVMLANLASLTREPAALGAGAWLKEDLLSQPLVSVGGVIFPEDLAIRPDILTPRFKNQLALT